MCQSMEKENGTLSDGRESTYTLPYTETKREGTLSYGDGREPTVHRQSHQSSSTFRAFVTVPIIINIQRNENGEVDGGKLNNETVERTVGRGEALITGARVNNVEKRWRRMRRETDRI
jgi:hypothetical protein